MTRHQLLLAFLAMMRGHTSDAHARLAAAGADRPTLEPRDELFAAAITVGLARREGDLSALRPGWSRARQALLQHPVDLYVLLPLGELAVAAARLSEQGWIEPHLREAEALLGRLGQPPLWAVPLHWYGVHAAITGESPQEARRHVSALAAATTAGPFAAVLAAAASGWMRVLAGTADAELVVTTARQLAAAGLGSEGSRLAGQAAIRATDRKTMAVLLECARAVRPEEPSGPAGPGAARDGAPAAPPDRGRTRPGAASSPAGTRPPAVAHCRRPPVTSRPEAGTRRHAQRPGTGDRPPGPHRADLQGDRGAAVHLGQDRGAPHGPDPPPAGRDQPPRAVRPAAGHAERRSKTRG